MENIKGQLVHIIIAICYCHGRVTIYNCTIGINRHFVQFFHFHQLGAFTLLRRILLAV